MITPKVIKSWLNYEYENEQYEYTGEETNTVPDKTITIQEMFDRLEAGIAVGQYMPQKGQPYYNEEQLLPNLKAMDLTAIDEMSRSIKENIEEGQQRYNMLKKEQYDREIGAAAAAQLEQRRRRETNNSGESIQPPANTTE